MARLEKWLTEVGPDAPIPRAARAALATRLKAVEHFLKQASQVTSKAEDDAEAVHQLRIWTRRAAAALRLFGDVLPRRTAQWLKRTLKKIRQTAGEARDCDVLADRIENGELPGLTPTAVHLRVRRKRAEKHLAKKYKSLIRSGKFRRKGDKLLAKIERRSGTKNAQRRGGQSPFGPWCRAQLRPLAEEFHELAAGSLTQDARLHQLRLAGKRLRYALELAPAAFPAAIHRRLYDKLSDVQDRLGQVCDQIVAVRQLDTLIESARGEGAAKELRGARSHQREQLAAARQRWRRWWTPKRRTSIRKSWKRALRD